MRGLACEDMTAIRLSKKYWRQDMTQDILEMYDRSRVGRIFWCSFSLFCAGYALDFFDFYIVGFLVAVLGPQWHLTYLQSALILLSAGVGSIFGALTFGYFADRLGRKPMVIAGTLVCAIGSGAIALIPDGAWELFAVLRFIVGIGLGGAATCMTVLIVESTPTGLRRYLGGMPIVAASVGSLIAASSSAALLQHFGWRGVALLGLAPAIVGLAMLLVMPESVPWLLSKGLVEKARISVSRLTGLDLSQVPQTAAYKPVASNSSFREVYRDPSRFWFVLLTWAAFSTAGYGVYLWGPTIVAMVLAITPAAAAKYFICVSLAGIVGRLSFSVLPLWINRKALGVLYGLGIAVTLGCAALFTHELILGFPIFVIAIAAGALFFDGGWCAISPYTAEIFPVRLAARGIGVGNAANGLGKILGPLCLMVIAGASNFVTPKATSEAVMPAFLFLAGCGLFVGLSFLVWAPRPPARGLVLHEETPPARTHRQVRLNPTH